MFKQKIKDFTASVKEAFGGLRVTLILVALATILAAFLLDFESVWDFGENSFPTILFYVILFLGLFAIGTFFAETAFQEKKGLKTIFILLSGVLSAAYTVVFKWNPFEWSEDFRNSYILLYTVCYAVVAVLMGVYVCYKRSALKFNQYALGVFMNSFKIGIITSILSSGLLMVVLAIVALFVTGETLIFRVEVLVFGLIAVPGLLFSVRNAKDENGRFPKILTSFVAFPIVVIAYLVIYVYLTKILVTWNVPSNSLFIIIAILYFVAIPVLTMTEHSNQSKFYEKAIRILYIAFLPFIAMQIYCLGIRIYEHGITPERYIGIIAIIVELVYLMLSIFRANIRGLILPTVAVLSVLALVMPGTNVNDASRRSQTRILQKFEKRGGDAKAARKAYGAYEYLLDLPEEVPTYLSKMTDSERFDLRDRITEAKTEGGEEIIFNESFYDDLVKYGSHDEPVDISGFKTLQEVEGYYYEYSDGIQGRNHKDYPDELYEYDLFDGMNTVYVMDITKLIDDYYQNHNGEALKGEEQFIELDPTHVLYLKQLYISGEYMDDGFRNVTNVSLSGWLFTR